MNEFFTWTFLASFAGSCVATGVVTQFLKGVFAKLPTQVLSYIVAVCILALGTQFTVGLTVSNGLLCLLNGMLVATATSGTFDAARRLIRGKK